MSYPIITVVIPSCNRADSLRICLQAFKRQTLNSAYFEIIIINDGSSDGTEEFLASFLKTTDLQANCINQENQGVSAARNRGILKAMGKYVAFTDDDCIVPNDWLERIISALQQAEPVIAGVGGPLDTITANGDSFTSRFIQYIDEFNYIPVLNRLLIRPRYINRLGENDVVPYLRTSNAAFQKKCLMECDGFDTAFRKPGGEDPDLCYRLLARKYKFMFMKDLVVAHQTRDSLSAYFRSLRNYVLGEIRSSGKKASYVHPAIIRTYSLLPLQKAAAIIICSIRYPIAVFKLFQSGKYKYSEAFIFPCLVIASKWYALWIVTCFLLRRTIKCST